MDLVTVGWALGACLLAAVSFIIAFTVWVQWQSHHLQAVAGKAQEESSVAEGVVVPGAPTPVHAFRTPGGTPFLAFSQYEANVLMHEMYHGSTESRVSATGLQECGTEHPFIVDVGANVGTFTVWMKEQFPGASILCVEALPPTAALLRSNVRAAGLQDVTIVESGAGSKAVDSVTFSFSPGMSVGGASVGGKATMDQAADAATAAPGLLATLADVAADVRRTFAEVHTVPAASRASAAAATLAEAVAPDGSYLSGTSLATMAADVAAWGRLAGEIAPLLSVQKEYSVSLTPLSHIIAAHEGASPRPTIDYLKVDVEGAEEDVLAGITPADWARTRGVMVEVHDAGGALGRVVDLLTELGFGVKTAQEVWRVHTRLGIYLVYGTRPEGWVPQ